MAQAVPRGWPYSPVCPEILTTLLVNSEESQFDELSGFFSTAKILKIPRKKFVSEPDRE